MQENHSPTQTIALRSIEAEDTDFLRSVYASTRIDELAPLGWVQAQIDAFLGSQFEAQRQDYWKNYDTSRFCIVSVDGVDAGRLYVERRADQMSIVDIALLPSFRSRGVGGDLLAQLLDEADAAALPLRIHVEFNNPAQRLYLRCGFVFRGEPVGIYRMMERAPQKRDP
ncbi:MAG: GNAT family N-acetyltransferase [Dokdonella sp.]